MPRAEHGKFQMSSLVSLRVLGGERRHAGLGAQELTIVASSCCLKSWNLPTGIAKSKNVVALFRDSADEAILEEVGNYSSP